MTNNGKVAEAEAEEVISTALHKHFLISKTSALRARPRRVKEISVDEWEPGAFVIARTLPQTELDVMSRAYRRYKPDGTWELDNDRWEREWLADLISHMIVDPDGEPVFTKDEALSLKLQDSFIWRRFDTECSALLRGETGEDPKTSQIMKNGSSGTD